MDVLEHGGFSAFVVMAHTNAIYSPPGVGGILLEQPEGDFQIDHDQKFNATTNVQYAFEKRIGAWAASVLAGRFRTRCRGRRQSRGCARTDCGSADGDRVLLRRSECHSRCRTHERRLHELNFGATRLKNPAGGAADDVTNPPRIAPRHLFDLGLGIDNLLHTDRPKLRVRFSAINLTNKEALYNFLSTFSGTHFVTPRAYQVQVGVTF